MVLCHLLYSPSPFSVFFSSLTPSVELAPRQRSNLRSCVTFHSIHMKALSRITLLQTSYHLLLGIHVSFRIRQSQTRERRCAISARRLRFDDVAAHIILVESDSCIVLVAVSPSAVILVVQMMLTSKWRMAAIDQFSCYISRR